MATLVSCIMSLDEPYFVFGKKTGPSCEQKVVKCY